MTGPRHLKAVPTLVGKWRAYPAENPMWLQPADAEAHAMGIRYLPLQHNPRVTPLKGIR